MSEAVNKSAQAIVESGDVFITNSMVVSWIVTITLIILARIATSNMKLIPSGLQNIMEFCFESIYNLLESILGEHLIKKTFWFFSITFIFIVFSNWSGLLPLTGNFTTKINGQNVPIWRPGTADVNLTLAMAIVFMFLWFVWSIQEIGFVGFLKHIFAPKGSTAGFMGIIMIVVALCVGVIEVISMLFRPISLSFRLFGNIFGGENVMHAMAKPLVGVPFYFMEIMVGLIQGMVFAMLSAVFLALMCKHEDSHDHKEEH